MLIMQTIRVVFRLQLAGEHLRADLPGSSGLLKNLHPCHPEVAPVLRD
jgi:hypothetical protein